MTKIYHLLTPNMINELKLIIAYLVLTDVIYSISASFKVGVELQRFLNEDFPFTVYGDILVSKNISVDESSSDARAAVLGSYETGDLWPYDIHSGTYHVPFEIDEDFNEAEIDIIETAMDVIEANSHVRFVPHHNEVDYVHIYTGFGGCKSPVGRQHGMQPLLLQRTTPEKGSCIRYGVIIHELLHTLGMGHEHQRPDRDFYITLHAQNLAKGHEADFNVDQNLRAATPFDFASVMLYDRFSFSATGLPVYDIIGSIDVKNAELVADAERVTGSACDWSAVNELYPSDPNSSSKAVLCQPNQFSNVCKPTSAGAALSNIEFLCHYQCNKGMEYGVCEFSREYASAASPLYCSGVLYIMAFALVSFII